MIEKLTPDELRPAPWRVERFEHGHNNVECWDVTYGPGGDPAERFSVLEDDDEVKYVGALKLLALARNWLDVQERRHWIVRRVWSSNQPTQWLVATETNTPLFLPVAGSILEAIQSAVSHDAELTRQEKGGA